MTDRFDALADRLADRVIERMEECLRQRDHPDRLLTATEAADALGRRPEWVRAHADELGVIRLTDGPRPRLYFRPEEIKRRRNGGIADPPSSDSR
ncbi:MAG: hypothetical protein AABM42_02280 [Actinomycetota bacterium]